MGYAVHLIGWDKTPSLTKEINLGHATAHIMKRQMRNGRATLAGKCFYWVHMIKELLKLRPDIVTCVNEDNALSALPFKHVLYRIMVIDIYDALVDRYSHHPRLLCWVHRAISRIVRSSADALIATDKDRYARFGRYQAKAIVVDNMPEDPGAELSRQMPEGPLKLFVAGTLNMQRGIKLVLDAVERIDNCKIVAAGPLYDEYAINIFAQHPLVDFNGILTSRAALELAAGCDGIFAFYAPISVNNVHASPNKLHDAMSVGRPLIINEEVLVSQWVVDNKLGYRCPYDDAAALEQIIRSLARHRDQLPSFAARTRTMFEKDHTWEKMASRLDQLYMRYAKPGTIQSEGQPCSGDERDHQTTERDETNISGR